MKSVVNYIIKLNLTLLVKNPLKLDRILLFGSKSELRSLAIVQYVHPDHYVILKLILYQCGIIIARGGEVPV